MPNSEVVLRLVGPGFVLLPATVAALQYGVTNYDFIPVVVPAGKMLEVIMRDQPPVTHPERN